MFRINYRKRVARLFGLSLDEVNELLKRMHGHFKKQGISHDEIARAFFILQDIQERKEKHRIEQSVPLLDFKHKGIKRYRVEIVRLKEEGQSTEKIAKALQHKKDAPSLSTIKRYLKALGDWRKNNGES